MKKNRLFFIPIRFFCYFCKRIAIKMKKLAYLFMSLLFANLFFAGCKNKSDRQVQQIDTIPMLVMQIQKCSRLYTTEYKVHKIVTYDDVMRMQGQILNKRFSVRLPLGDRKVAIPMTATLKAYIDFSDFSKENVSKQNGKLVVTLPDPRVVMTDSKIDQAGVREYVSLTRSYFSDRELSAFELQGREAIIESIPKLGIIERARESAARQLVPMFVAMGYREQDITVSFSRDYQAGDIRSLLDFNNVER